MELFKVGISNRANNFLLPSGIGHEFLAYQLFAFLYLFEKLLENSKNDLPIKRIYIYI